MLKHLVLIIILLIAFLSSCKPERKKPKSFSEIQSYEKPLENVNKLLLKKDEQTIANYSKRRGWKMKMTKSGLWYGSLKETALDSVKQGDIIEIDYRVELLDGKVLYNSDSLGTMVFEVGHSVVENGLEEGVLMMKDKEKFRFILPPHKAHGLLGDLQKIPARSIIVYYVEIINIQH